MTDTSPKRLLELADIARNWMPEMHETLLALAAEKEPQQPELSMSMFASKEDYRKAVEEQQRERMEARFAASAPSPPTADFDLPHESDDASGHAEQPLEMAKPSGSLQARRNSTDGAQIYEAQQPANGRDAMIEKLNWHDADKVKPSVSTSVLLWTRDSRPFSPEFWSVGYWQEGSWWNSDDNEKRRDIVTHWAEPNGPFANKGT